MQILAGALDGLNPSELHNTWNFMARRRDAWWISREFLRASAGRLLNSRFKTSLPADRY
jgi:hypothetical protein